MTAFDSAFVEWLSMLPGTRFRDAEERLSMSLFDGEEVYYFDELPDGWMRLTQRIRGGGPYWYLDGAALEVLEVFLSVKYSDSPRADAGFGFLDRRERVGRGTDRIERRVVPWQGPQIPGAEPSRMEELSSAGRPVARFGYPLGAHTPREGMPSIVAGATWYIDRPLDDVLASLRHPTGAPLFELLGDRRA